MSVKIESAAHAVQLLDAVKNSKSYDYRYVDPSSANDVECRYFGSADNDGSKEPGCIVGHVLARLGYEPKFDEAGTYRMDGIEGTGARSLVDNGHIKAPAIVGVILETAQRAQDNGMTWFQSVEQARLVKEAYEMASTAA